MKKTLFTLFISFVLLFNMTITNALNIQDIYFADKVSKNEILKTSQDKAVYEAVKNILNKEYNKMGYSDEKKLETIKNALQNGKQVFLNYYNKSQDKTNIELVIKSLNAYVLDLMTELYGNETAINPNFDVNNIVKVTDPYNIKEEIETENNKVTENKEEIETKKEEIIEDNTEVGIVKMSDDFVIKYGMQRADGTLQLPGKIVVTIEGNKTSEEINAHLNSLMDKYYGNGYIPMDFAPADIIAASDNILVYGIDVEAIKGARERVTENGKCEMTEVRYSYQYDGSGVSLRETYLCGEYEASGKMYPITRSLEYGSAFPGGYGFIQLPTGGLWYPVLAKVISENGYTGKCGISCFADMEEFRKDVRYQAPVTWEDYLKNGTSGYEHVKAKLLRNRAGHIYYTEEEAEAEIARINKLEDGVEKTVLLANIENAISRRNRINGYLEQLEQEAYHLKGRTKGNGYDFIKGELTRIIKKESEGPDADAQKGYIENLKRELELLEQEEFGQK